MYTCKAAYLVEIALDAGDRVRLRRVLVLGEGLGDKREFLGGAVDRSAAVCWTIIKTHKIITMSVRMNMINKKTTRGKATRWQHPTLPAARPGAPPAHPATRQTPRARRPRAQRPRATGTRSRRSPRTRGRRSGLRNATSIIIIIIIIVVVCRGQTRVRGEG
jgi:hypothetical protein